MEGSLGVSKPVPTLATETIARTINRSEKMESRAEMLNQNSVKGGTDLYNKDVNKCVFP